MDGLQFGRHQELAANYARLIRKALAVPSLGTDLLSCLLIIALSFSPPSAEASAQASLKQLSDLLHLLVDHLGWRLLANNRVGPTEAIPEIVDLMSLMANERCCSRRAFALLQTLTKRLLFGR